METKVCKDCKYYHWYHDENKKYGCDSEPFRDICGSFVPVGFDYLDYKQMRSNKEKKVKGA